MFQTINVSCYISFGIWSSSHSHFCCHWYVSCKNALFKLMFTHAENLWWCLAIRLSVTSAFRVHHGLSSLCRILSWQAPLINCLPWSLLFTPNVQAALSTKGGYRLARWLFCWSQTDAWWELDQTNVLDDRAFEHPIVQEVTPIEWDKKRCFQKFK